MCSSNTARVKRIENVPNKEQEKNLEALIDNILDPLREAYGKPINVSSGFRSYHLNKAVGGVSNSDHLKGMAADIYCSNRSDHQKIFDYIKNNFKFTQLIWENNGQWIHISYNKNNLKNQILYL